MATQLLYQHTFRAQDQCPLTMLDEVQMELGSCGKNSWNGYSNATREQTSRKTSTTTKASTIARDKVSIRPVSMYEERDIVRSLSDTQLLSCNKKTDQQQGMAVLPSPGVVGKRPSLLQKLTSSRRRSHKTSNVLKMRALKPGIRKRFTLNTKWSESQEDLCNETRDSEQSTESEPTIADIDIEVTK